MTSCEEKNLRIAKAFWYSVHSEDKHEGIDEYVAKNHIHYSQFGMAVGNAQLHQETLSFFSMFDVLDNTIDDCIARGNLAHFSAIRRIKHIGTFRELDPTGNTATNQITANLNIHDNQITHFSIIEDTKPFLTALVGAEQAKLAMQRPMLNHSSHHDIQRLCALFRDKGIKITPQHLKCLSLWFAHYSYRDIAQALRLSHSTVDSYLSAIRIACHVYNKRQLFELLVENNLLEALLACKRIVLNQNSPS